MAIGKIESLAGYFILLWGWKRSAASLIAGLVSAFALPPYNGFPILFATFAIFIWLLDGAATEPAAGFIGKGWSSFKVGWWFGFGYFLSGLWWVGTAFLVEADEFAWLMPIAVIVLPALLAIFWGLAAAFARIFWSEDWHRIIVFSVFLALAEYLRGNLFTGLPWNALGYTAMPIPLMMQSASLIGIFGVTLLSIPVFAAMGVFTPKSALRPRGTTKMLVFALALLLAHLGFGYWRLSQASDEMVADVSLRLVQPAIAQNEKWLPEKEAEIFKRYLTLSTQEILATQEISAEKKGLSGTTHLIWPESAFPFLLTERKDALAAIGAMLPEGTTLITGAARVESSVAGQAGGFVFNSIYTIDAEGVIASAADKVHLVPFGEYLPFQELAESLGLQQLTKIRGGFEPGNIRPLLSAMSGPAFLPLICYEIIFSGDVQPKDSDKKPEWIVNLTNDAWFGMTPGPYQHLQQAIVRGVEEGLPVVRVANSGISSVSDSYGRVLGQIALGEMGVIDAKLPKPSPGTFFSQFGYWSFFVLAGIMFVAGVFGRRQAD
ncbi:MAG: apolipoprotein N-acyltransferase [Hyphomicrobiales bacterium]|nr:MAG: apolipoprotein N-acyltransferase [Hyphomicrobiales bacterium]